MPETSRELYIPETADQFKQRVETVNVERQREEARFVEENVKPLLTPQVLDIAEEALNSAFSVFFEQTDTKNAVQGAYFRLDEKNTLFSKELKRLSNGDSPRAVRLLGKLISEHARRYFPEAYQAGYQIEFFTYQDTIKGGCTLHARVSIAEK